MVGIRRWDEPARTAYLDSALIHIRAMNEFLGGMGSRKGFPFDVAATDYASMWDEAKPIDSFSIARKVAHITCQRENLLDWMTNPEYLIEWREGIEQTFVRFLAVLGEEHPERVAWFDMS